MARADILSRLYSANISPLEFNFQALTAPPLLSLLSPYDIKRLNDIARDPRLSAKLNKKLDMIKAILEPRGFVKFHSGTNRVVYRFLEDQSFLIKVALDKTGLSDNPMEYKNQFLLAPFVTKVFEVSPCGTVGLFERVEPITSRLEFISVADDVFNLLNDNIIGKYVLEDIGTDYFMNFGIRKNVGPVLLDFPYCYELDGNKLYCNKMDLSGLPVPCGGAIDYDAGFNNLVCTKCGAKVFARDLQKKIDNQNIILKGRKERSTMIVKCHIPGQEDKVNDTTVSSKTYVETARRKSSSMKVEILKNENAISREEEMRQIYERSQASINKKKEEEKEEIEERNANKHKYVAKQSAPYARPSEEDTSYIDMNKDDDDEEVEYNEDEDKRDIPKFLKDASNKSNITDADILGSGSKNGYPAKKQRRDKNGRFIKD